MPGPGCAAVNLIACIEEEAMYNEGQGRDAECMYYTVLSGKTGSASYRHNGKLVELLGAHTSVQRPHPLAFARTLAKHL